MPLTEAPYTGTVYSDEQMLAEFQAAIRGLLLTGQSYTLFGSRVVTMADAKWLGEQEEKYRKRVLAANGWDGRNHADFSDCNGGDELED